MEGVKTVSLMLLSNTIQMTSNSNSLVETFDLKGSWYHRLCHPWEKMTKMDRNLMNLKAALHRKQQRGILQFDPFRDIQQIRREVESDS